MSVFRTQRVTKILFHLDTATCKATVTLHCENGALRCAALRCAALRCAVCAASMPRSRPPAYVPTCLPACQPFTPAPIVCPPAPAGLVKSYRLPTMDSEILQVLQACLPGTMLVPCTLLIAV